MLLDVGVADYGVMGTSDWTTNSARKGIVGGQRLERQADGCIREMRSIRVFIGLASGTSTSTKCTGRIGLGVALALTLTDAPNDVNAMYGGRLDLWLGPTAIQLEQWLERTTGVEGTMKEFVEVALGVSGSGIHTRIAPDGGRCDPARCAPVYRSAPPIRPAGCGWRYSPASSPTRIHRDSWQADRRRSDDNGCRTRTHHTTTADSGRERHQRSRYPTVEKRSSFFLQGQRTCKG